MAAALLLLFLVGLFGGILFGEVVRVFRALVWGAFSVVSPSAREGE